MEHDHVFYKDWDGVEAAIVPDPALLIPPPDERNIKRAFKKSNVMKPLPQQAAFTAQNFEDVAFYDLVGDRCCECGKSMALGGT